MNTKDLKEWLSKNGFVNQGNGRYWAKPVGNGWYINVEWQGDTKYPAVQATHNSQFKPTLGNPWYVPFESDHTKFNLNPNEITTNKRYVRNRESRTWTNQLVPAGVKLLEYRLK